MVPTASYGLLDPDFHADPGPILDQARRDAPVHWDPSLGTWVLCRWDDNASALRDPAFSVDRGGSISGLGAPELAAELAWCSDFALRWMTFSDPPRHTRVRLAVHRWFTSTAIAAQRPRIEALTAAAIAKVAATGRMEVLADVAVPVPALVTAEMLGLPAGDTELLKGWTNDMFALFGAGVAGAAVIRAAHRSMTACRDYFADLVAARRRRPGDDLLSALATSPDAAGLDDDERIGLCATLVAGAYETTTHVVGNGLWALLRHPEALARLRREPDLAVHAVEEIFRWDGPAFAVMRRARDATTIAGVDIAAGDRIYCLLYAANRDPARHPGAERFDLGRADPRHLGLGHGVHFCLGAALSRLETAVMLNALVALPGLTLDDAEPAPRYQANLAIRGLHALPVRFDAA